MIFTSDDEIEKLVEQFIDKTLPKINWTHHAHLTVGFWHLIQYPKYEAICRMKSAIILYNVAVETQNTAESGYHETLTLFWLNVLDKFLANNPNKKLYEICNLFFESEFSKTNYVFKFYDKEELMSVKLRAQYFEPTKTFDAH